MPVDRATDSSGAGPEQRRRASSVDASFLLVRIDDRLLHGQVSLGWGPSLSVRTYLIVDDRVAADPWEREVFAMAAPEGAAADVLSVTSFLETLVRAHGKGQTAAQVWERPLLLLRSTETLAELARGGFAPATVNLGGCHARPGTVRLTEELHLSAAEMARLAELARLGIAISAQTHPNSLRLTWGQIVERAERAGLSWTESDGKQGQGGAAGRRECG